MAIIPNPVSGQPIDYAYINAIVNQTNTLTTSFSSTNTKAILGGVEQSKLPLIVTAMKLLGQTSLDVGKETTVTLPFGSNAKFASPPTITLSYEPDSATSLLVSITVSAITNSQATITIANTATSKKTVGGKIHAIIIGVSAGSAG
jgi:hypothetical protein